MKAKSAPATAMTSSAHLAEGGAVILPHELHIHYGLCYNYLMALWTVLTHAKLWCARHHPLRPELREDVGHQRLPRD
jgi:hypothetical protein